MKIHPPMATCLFCLRSTDAHAQFCTLARVHNPPNSCLRVYVYVCMRACSPDSPCNHPLSLHPPHSHAMAVCGRLPRPLWPPQSRAAFSVPRGLQRSRLAPDSHRVYVLCNCRPQSKQEAGVCQNELAFPPSEV